MKINEVTAVDEAPVGGIKQAARTMGARALKRVPGMGNTAANLAGRANLGATANNLYKQFNQYLGTQNKTVANATAKDLKRFLKSKNTKSKELDAMPDISALNKEMVNNIMMKVSTRAMRGASGAGTPPASGGSNTPPAPGGTPPASGGSNTPPAPGGTTIPTGGSGTPPAPGGTTIPTGMTLTASDGQQYKWAGAQWIGANGRMAKRAIGQELKQAAQQAMTVPDKIRKAVGKLTPQQKTALKSML